MIRSFIYTEDKKTKCRKSYDSKNIKSMNQTDIHVGESGFLLIYHSDFMEIFYDSKIYMKSILLDNDFKTIMKLIKKNENFYRSEKIKRLL